jgi:arylsulfatase A-like enzyme
LHFPVSHFDFSRFGSSRLFSRGAALLTSLLVTLAALLSCRPAQAETTATQPNVIIILADDLGYGDTGCYGQKRIKTPNIDRMASQGVRFTDFYAGAPVCTPSRASLMTGCYPQRIGMAATPEPRRPGMANVLRSDSRYGLNPDEVTIAELLKSRGYVSACVGKWHLGHLPPFLPTRQGFDSYFGVPYSNDMKPTVLMRNEQVIEQNVQQPTLIERYTQEATSFIRANRERPFFLYLAHNAPHTPLSASEKFRGRSRGGLYGDMVEGVDWSVGQVLATVKELGLDEKTCVVFTSDNGPWLNKGEDGGFATPLRAGKGKTYEGGVRVPCVMRWPGIIPQGSTCSEIAAIMDLMPTFVTLAGGSVPTDRIIDGRSIFALMTGQPGAKSPHEALFYYQMNELQAVRSGEWKLKLSTTAFNDGAWQGFGDRDTTVPTALYNLETDIGEQKTVLREHPDVVKRLRALADEARQDLGDTRMGVVGKNVRKAGHLPDTATSATK